MIIRTAKSMPTTRMEMSRSQTQQTAKSLKGPDSSKFKRPFPMDMMKKSPLRLIYGTLWTTGASLDSKLKPLRLSEMMSIL